MIQWLDRSFDEFRDRKLTNHPEADMNTMCKPVYEIIERNEAFFCRLDKISDIYVVGHSCGEVDYPYFRKAKSSVAYDAEWHFNPFSDKDEMNIGLLRKAIGIAK